VADQLITINAQCLANIVRKHAGSQSFLGNWLAVEESLIRNGFLKSPIKAGDKVRHKETGQQGIVVRRFTDYSSVVDDIVQDGGWDPAPYDPVYILMCHPDWEPFEAPIVTAWQHRDVEKVW
jgi:hypothetical protein